MVDSGYIDAFREGFDAALEYLPQNELGKGVYNFMEELREALIPAAKDELDCGDRDEYNVTGGKIETLYSLIMSENVYIINKIFGSCFDDFNINLKNSLPLMKGVLVEVVNYLEGLGYTSEDYWNDVKERDIQRQLKREIIDASSLEYIPRVECEDPGEEDFIFSGLEEEV